MPETGNAESAPQRPPAALPPDALAILPARNIVLFPGMMLPLAVGRPLSIAAAQHSARQQRPVGILLQTDPAIEDPTPDRLHRVGTTAEILRYVTAPDGTHHVVCRGIRRLRVIEFLDGYPFLAARSLPRRSRACSRPRR